jgi:hypothetical protein
MRISHPLRIHKGTIAALLVFVPFIVATAKLTYFNKGCMDGFGHFIFGSAVIVFIGGPLTVLASIRLLIEFRSFFPTLTTKDKSFYLFGHTLAISAMPLAVWVALEISHQKVPFDFRSELYNVSLIASQPPQISPILVIPE